MFVACGQALAPIRIIENFLGKKITEASFSSPIRIIGFDKLPKVGTKFKTFEDKIEDKPLLRAFYNPDYMQSLIETAGWRMDSFHDKQGDSFVKSHFVCSPA